MATQTLIDRLNLELARVGNNRMTAYACQYPLAPVAGEVAELLPAVHGYSDNGYIDAHATLANLAKLDRSELESMVPGYEACGMVSSAIAFVKPWEV